MIARPNDSEFELTLLLCNYTSLSSGHPVSATVDMYLENGNPSTAAVSSRHTAVISLAPAVAPTVGPGSSAATA